MTPFYTAVTVILVVAVVLLIILYYYKELYQLPHKEWAVFALCLLVVVVVVAYQMLPAWRRSDAYATDTDSGVALPKSLDVPCARA